MRILKWQKKKKTDANNFIISDILYNPHEGSLLVQWSSYLSPDSVFTGKL